MGISGLPRACIESPGRDRRTIVLRSRRPMSTAEMNPSRKHAYTDPGIPQLPEPTYAERVRTLVSLCTIATLSTVSRKRPGYPFGSLMPYAIDGTGRPIFLISNMAMHTQNIQADPRASLFVGQVGDGDPLGTARATLVGDVLPVPEDEVSEARQRYLSRYENSRSWVDFKDFGFYRLRAPGHLLCRRLWGHGMGDRGGLPVRQG